MITIKDVAREAGVSIATVSRALNLPDTVSPDALVRVNRAIKVLGYAPNMIARSLKVQASRTVGIIVPDLGNPFQVRIIKGATRLLYAEGYTPLICDTEEDPDKETMYLKNLVERRIDGLIFVPVYQHRQPDRQIRQMRFPLVFVDRHISEEHDCVQSNNQAGISLLVGYLFGLGHRSIALIGGPRLSVNGREREEAFLAMLDQYGLDRQRNPVAESDFTVDGGYLAARNLLRADPRPRAIITANNLMGMGALKAIKEAGLSIPGDVVLVTYDGVGELVDPPLTYVRQPAEEMGTEAARLLVERLKGEGGQPPRLVRFEPTLQVSRPPVADPGPAKP